MSEVLKDAIQYIEQSKLSLLATVGEGSSPSIRPIGAFSNDAADIYFFTAREAKKVEHIKKNSKVTFYFQNEGQPVQSFKSLAVTGEAVEVNPGEEFSKAIAGISRRYPDITKLLPASGSKETAIFKVKAQQIRLIDYTKSQKDFVENL